MMSRCNRRTRKRANRMRSNLVRITATFPSISQIRVERRVLLLKLLQWTLRSPITHVWLLTVWLSRRRSTDLRDRSRVTLAPTSRLWMRESKPLSLSTLRALESMNTWLPSLSVCHWIRIRDSTCLGCQTSRSSSTNEH